MLSALTNPTSQNKVRIMGEIYKSAQRVLIWLSPATESDRLRLESMFDLHKYIQIELRLKSWSQYPVQAQATTLQNFCEAQGPQWNPDDDA
jgi:hypothetical protein